MAGLAVRRFAGAWRLERGEDMRAPPLPAIEDDMR